MSPTAIRNVALVGQAGSGKTALAEAMLVAMGVIHQAGDVLAGTTHSDFDAEEIRRHMSMQTALLTGRWKNTKINLLDTPGYADFWPDTQRAIRAADAVLLVLDGTKGIEVQTQRAWTEAATLGLPVMLVVTKLDAAKADFLAVVSDVHGTLSPDTWSCTVPVGSGPELTGVAELLTGTLDAGGPMRAWTAVEAEAFSQQRTVFMEAATELDEGLLDRYLAGETITVGELGLAWRQDVVTRKLFPVLAVSAQQGLGVQALLDSIVDLAPAPEERPPLLCTDPASGETWTVDMADEKMLCAWIFKTFHDPYAGKTSLFRVYSGMLRPDETVWDATRAQPERFGRLFTLVGKEHIPVEEVQPGDIAAVAKLKEAQTGDTILAQALSSRPFVVNLLPSPPPLYAVALTPTAKGEDQKLSSLLHRLHEDEPSLTVSVEDGTHRTILAGTGQTEVEVALHRLEAAGLHLDVSPPQIPYRETITRVARAQGKHKKQTGGHGQYGDVWLRLEPRPEGSGYAYASEVVGGVVPKAYLPAVDRGVQEVAAHGPLIGAPVVDFQAVIYDGSSHSVDSSEMAFKMAAHLAFKKAYAEAAPLLLEPMLHLSVTVPEDMTGDVISDLATRRAQVQGIDTLGHLQVVRALVPMAEVVAYAPVLSSITRGSGTYSAEFAHYEPVPPAIQDKLLDEHRKLTHV
jgi:elongation factor G